MVAVYGLGLGSRVVLSADGNDRKENGSYYLEFGA